MKQVQRYDTATELIKEQDYVSMEKLVEQFVVDLQIIRRDLDDLAEQRVTPHHHGGAALPSNSVDTSWHNRKVTQTTEKERIARWVASEIPGGAMPLTDIGTTSEVVAHAPFDHHNLCIVIDNLDATNTLMIKEDFRTTLVSGELRSRDGGVIREATLGFVS